VNVRFPPPTASTLNASTSSSLQVDSAGLRSPRLTNCADELRQIIFVNLRYERITSCSAPGRRPHRNVDLGSWRFGPDRMRAKPIRTRVPDRHLGDAVTRMRVARIGMLSSSYSRGPAGITNVHMNTRVLYDNRCAWPSYLRTRNAESAFLPTTCRIAHRGTQNIQLWARTEETLRER
jgi:hypothetical protein